MTPVFLNWWNVVVKISTICLLSNRSLNCLCGEKSLWKGRIHTVKHMYVSDCAHSCPKAVLWLLVILWRYCHWSRLHSSMLCYALVILIPLPHPIPQVSKVLGGWVSYPRHCSEWLSGEWNFCSPYPQVALPGAMLGRSPREAIQNRSGSDSSPPSPQLPPFMDDWWVRAMTEEPVLAGLGNNFFEKLINWSITIINVPGLNKSQSYNDI